MIRAPLLKLENEKGLSLELVRSLTNQLKHKAEAEKGREIVHDICVDIQEFLYLNNKPPAKSFYEQRLENQLKLTTQETGVDEDPLQLAAKKELAANKAAEDNLLVSAVVKKLINLLLTPKTSNLTIEPRNRKCSR